MIRAAAATSAVLFAVLATAAPAGPPAADYPQAHWLAASTSNYSRANRPLSGPINMVVVHATEGSYAGTLQWFRNPASHATTHYVIRSRTGTSRRWCARRTSRGTPATVT